MAKTVSLYDAKTHLSALVEEAAGGEEIVIAKNGKARARLVPLPAGPAAQGKRPLGFWKGHVHYAPGWDAPLPDDIVEEMLHGDEGDFAGPPPEVKGEGQGWESCSTAESWSWPPRAPSCRPASRPCSTT